MKYFIKNIILVTFLFVIFNCSKNSAPEIPSILSGKFTAEANTYMSYTISTSDPDGDDISYQFDWGDSNQYEKRYYEGFRI